MEKILLNFYRFFNQKKSKIFKIKYKINIIKEIYGSKNKKLIAGLNNTLNYFQSLIKLQSRTIKIMNKSNKYDFKL